MHDLKKTIQAVLFASAQKLELERIAKICKTTEEEALTYLEEWKKELDSNSNPMMLVSDEDGWRLTIREKFISVVRKVVKKTELPKSILETLSIVAYKVPVLQSNVIKIRTNKAYDHLRYLEKAGLITREKHGRTKMIKLSPKFYEYFDISPEKLKEKMQEKVKLKTFDTIEIVDEIESPVKPYTEKLGDLEVFEEKKAEKPKKKETKEEGAEKKVEEKVEKDVAEIKAQETKVSEPLRETDKVLENAEKEVEKKETKFETEGLYSKGMTPEMQKRVDKRVKEIVTGKKEKEEKKDDKKEE